MLRRRSVRKRGASRRCTTDCVCHHAEFRACTDTKGHHLTSFLLCTGGTQHMAAQMRRSGSILQRRRSGSAA
jgi:hypothetical protein